MAGVSNPHSYRDFIEPDQPMYLSDYDLLCKLQTHQPLTPHQLAEGRFRENVIRLQLYDLARIDSIRAIGHEAYELRPIGCDLLDTHPDHFSDGMVDLFEFDSKAFPPTDRRIRNFQSIDAKTLKRLNLDFFEEKGRVYGHVRENEPQLTSKRIRGVPDTDIHRIIREFPTTAPLPEACAHWVRAIVGLHLFPDANHRTATNSLEFLLEQSVGPDITIVTDDIPRFVLHSKYTRTFQSDVRFNTLWEQDELFAVWYRYFTRCLCSGLEGRESRMPLTNQLDSVLTTARTELVSLQNE